LHVNVKYIPVAAVMQSYWY